MNRHDFTRTVAALPFGKRLPTALYLWAPESNQLPHTLAAMVDKLRLRLELGPDFNLIKFSPRDFALSFLRYPDFIRLPHPVLAESVRVSLATGKTKRIDYTGHSNPPILHRKEAFLPPGHPKHRLFSRLTRREEEAGLFENPSTIGFRENWDRLLATKGLTYRGHQLAPREPAPPEEDGASPPESVVTIHRHRTALARTELSKPIRQAMEMGVLTEGQSVFDYGCGLGTDADGLRLMGYEAAAWDPVYFPEGEKRHADFVNLGYVVNVIEDPAERVEVVVDAWRHARRTLVVAVMIHGQEGYQQVRDHGDGVLTARDTFQKYFDPAEIQGLIESALDVEAHPLALGIYAAFRDPRDAQAFLATRSRRHIDWDVLSRRLGFLRPRKRAGVIDLYERHKDLLDAFWNKVLELGRLPSPGEFFREAELKERIGGPRKVHRLFLDHYGPDTYDAARRQRKEDLLVYLALANFRKKVPLKHLPDALQADIKSHFGTYRQAREEGLRLLFSTGEEETLERAAAGLGCGWLDNREGHFTIHRSLLDDLPAALRVYVECGAHLYGDPREADLIKIHLWSRKLTFLHYDDFEEKPFPMLVTRIKIDLMRRFVTVFDHADGREHQILFFKERFLGPEFPGREKMVQLSRRLEKLGLTPGRLGSNDANAPSHERFQTFLRERGLTATLRPSRNPDRACPGAG